MTWSIRATGWLGRAHESREGFSYEAAVLDEFKKFLEAVKRIDTKGDSMTSNVSFVGAGLGPQNVDLPIGNVSPPQPITDPDYWRRLGARND